MKFITLIALLLSFAAMADIGLGNRSVSVDNTGALKAGSLEKVYINVVNGSGASVADGAVMVINTASDDGYSVTTSTTAGAIPVCVMSKPDGSACAANKLCRCQTYGYNSGVLFDSTNVSATAGQAAYISENNAGYVQAEAIASVAATDIPIGVFYDTTASSADVELFIKLR